MKDIAVMSEFNAINKVFTKDPTEYRLLTVGL